MKSLSNLILFLIVFFVVDSVHAQETDAVFSVKLKLQLSEPVLGNITDRCVEIRDLETQVLISSLATDSNGNVCSEFLIEKENGAFALIIQDNASGYKKDLITPVYIYSDTIIELHIDLMPKRICWDSFLVPYIYFEPNSSVIPDTSGYHHWEIESVVKEFELHFERGYKLKLTSYCGYKEPKHIAKKRLDSIVSDLIARGWSAENLIYEVGGMDDLFICEYCDGCHFAYLKGKGFTINRKYLRSKSKLEQLKLEQMRSCVKLEWTTPKEY